jgi:integrase/recombinase XerD
MSLQLYRRHRKTCSAEEWDKSFRKCRCPILAEGMLAGRWVRKSTKQLTFEKAQEVIDRWEQEGKIISAELTPTIKEASRAFLVELQSRKVSTATQNKHTKTIEGITQWTTSKGYAYLNQLSTGVLREWRGGWTEGPLTSLKKLERVKSFLKFCVENGWLPKNPAAPLRPPMIESSPTLPFTVEEFTRVLEATSQYAPKLPHRERMLAFVLILRWSGLRISDAMKLRREHIDEEGRLFLYTAKTGTPVKIPLPPEVIQSVGVLPWHDSGYLFWDQQSSERLDTATGNMRDSLGRLFKLANIQSGHAHRFRDTFAVELLQSGVSLEDVSILLGHRSIKVTERHYSPWVKARQDRLEEEVRKAWKKDS